MRALIGEVWLTASAILAVVGLLADSTVLLALGVLLFGTGGASRLWARVSLEDVAYRRELAENHAFVGEVVRLRLYLSNEKFLPVPWVEVREQLPRNLPVSGGRPRPSGIPRVAYLFRNASLGPHERLEWPMELRPQERGYYRIGPARLRSGDLFGFFEREQHLPQQDHIVVYPQTYPLPDLGFSSARPFGERRGGERIFEDPSRVVGVRDYLPGDPLKRVDWNATARVGRLQAKLYEPSRTQATVVALNITTLEHTWQGFDPVLLERGVSIAASLAQYVFDSGSALGLIANGSFPDADRPIRIGAGRRPDQLMRVLEALAVISAFTTSALATELESRSHALPVGATVLVVAAIMPADLVATLQRLRAQGHIVHVVKTSALEWEQPLSSIPLHDVEPLARALEAEQQVARREAGVETSAGARP